MFRFHFQRFFAPDDGGGGGGGEKTVPVEALQAERAKRQELEARLAKIEADGKAADEKRSQEAGDYRKLHDELKPAHEKATAELEALRKAEAKRLERISERNSARIKALPEAAQKALKPIASAMTPDDLADWMDEHGATFGAVIRPAGTISGAGRGHEEAIPAEASAEWQKYGKNLGVSERDWFDKNWKPRQKKT